MSLSHQPRAQSSFRGAQALALKAWFSAPATVLGQKWGLLLAVATAPSCLLTVSSFLPKRRRLIMMLSGPQWTSGRSFPFRAGHPLPGVERWQEEEGRHSTPCPPFSPPLHGG